MSLTFADSTLRLNNIPPVMTAQEVMAFLRVSRATLDRLVAAGRLGCVKTHPRGKRLFLRRAVEAFVQPDALPSPPTQPEPPPSWILRQTTP